MESREDRFARYRRRLTILRTKGGEMNAAEVAYASHLEDEITRPQDDRNR